MSADYELRPHHTFTGWFIIFKNGISLGARASKLEAEEFVRRHKHLEKLKEMEIRL